MATSVDVRPQYTIPLFDGSSGSWSEWQEQFRAFAGAVGCDAAFESCPTEEAEAESWKQASKKLYLHLIRACKGTPAQVVRSSQIDIAESTSCGHVAWKALGKRFGAVSLEGVNSKLSRLQSLSARISDSADLAAHLDEIVSLRLDLRTSGHKVDPKALISIVSTSLPSRLAYLRAQLARDSGEDVQAWFDALHSG